MTDRQAAEAREPLPRSSLTLDDVRSKLAGLHFSQESLTKDERAILYMAEALLRQIDALSDRMLDDAECCSVSAYFCPVAGEVECPRHGGFDVCCDEPERHVLVDDLVVQLRECEAALAQACMNLGTIRPLDMLRDGEHDISLGEAADRWRDLVLEQGRAAVAEEAPNPGGLPAATSPVEDLTRELGDLRRAGNELAEAAHRVSADYDGVHRLRLALSGWYAALANEWGREAP